MVEKIQVTKLNCKVDPDYNETYIPRTYNITVSRYENGTVIISDRDYEIAFPQQMIDDVIETLQRYKND